VISNQEQQTLVPRQRKYIVLGFADSFTDLLFREVHMIANLQ